MKTIENYYVKECIKMIQCQISVIKRSQLDTAQCFISDGIRESQEKHIYGVINMKGKVNIHVK